MDRIDPDEHAIGAKQLSAHLVCEVLVIDGRLGMDADRGELFENAVKSIAHRRRITARFAIATPKNCDFKAFLLGHHCILYKVVAELWEGQPDRSVTGGRPAD